MSDDQRNETIPIFTHKSLQQFNNGKFAVGEGMVDYIDRAQAYYFMQKYGHMPSEFSWSVPVTFHAISDLSFRLVLRKHKAEHFSLVSPPYLTNDKHYAGGTWISAKGDLVFEVGVSHSSQLVVYKIKGILGNSFASPDDVVKELDSFFKRAVRGRTLVAKPNSVIRLRRNELRDFPEWSQVKKTVPSEIVNKVEKAITFFDTANKLSAYGVEPRYGLLLYGAPGTGKTYLVESLIREMSSHCTIVVLNSETIASNNSSQIRSFFEFMMQFTPLTVVLEDLEVIAMDRKMMQGGSSNTTTLLDTISGVASKTHHVVIVATTNFIEHIDEAIKRPGRMDSLVEMLPPTPDLVHSAIDNMLNTAETERLRLNDTKTPPFILPVSYRELILSSKPPLTFAAIRYVLNEVIRIPILEGRPISRKELKEAVEVSLREQKVRASIGFRRMEQLQKASDEPDID